MPVNKRPEIRNIIFDLGGVLLNINPLLSLNEFARIGNTTPETLRKRLTEEHIFDKFDTGNLNNEQFRAEICRILNAKVSDDEIDRAWNILLLDFPAERVQLLKELGENYNVFLLSNTNGIHFRHFTSQFFVKHGIPMASLFQKLFLSHEIGIHKPDSGIYSFVLKQAGLTPEECVFYDDSLPNVEAAIKQGIRAVQITAEHDVLYYFEKGILKPDTIPD